MSKESYQIHITSQLDDQLIQEWQALWERAENKNVFNSYGWFCTARDTYRITDIEFFTCYKDERLVAIVPLCPSKKFGISVLGVVGSRFLVDTAFLVESYDKELLRVFFGSILAKHALYIRQMDSKVCEILQEIFPQLFFALASVNPRVTITGDPFAQMSSSTMKQIKKIIRQNPDQLHFTLFDGQSELEKHLQTMFELEQDSAKKTRGMDLFSHKENREFFINFSNNHLAQVRIGFLTFENKPIAYQFGFLVRNLFIAYQTAYRSEYGKLRPGKTMLYHLFKSLKDQADIVDLGGGISTYKMEFTSEYRLLYDVYFSKNGLVMAYWKFINAVRRFKQVLLPKKFTRDHEFLFRRLPLRARVN
jgi:CelD/BcsL family acetyltransferase involved in cellulose biosynthesis